MMEINTKLKKLGKSMGVSISPDIIKFEHLKEGDSVSLLIIKNKNVLKETFGSLKFKRSTDEILKEIDMEYSR